MSRMHRRVSIAVVMAAVIPLPSSRGAGERSLLSPAARMIADEHFPQFARRNHDTAANWAGLLERNCEHDWTQVVNRQLAPFKQGGVTLEGLEKHCTRRSLRVSIVSGEIRHAHSSGGRRRSGAGANRYVCALWLLQMAVLRAKATGRPLPDVELVMQSSDAAASTFEPQPREPGPLFGNIKCGNDASISFPMNFHDQFGAFGSGYMSMSLYNRSYEKLARLDRVGWSEKTPKLFFSAGHNAGKTSAEKRGHRADLLKIKSDLFAVTTEHAPLLQMAKYRYLVYAYGRCGWSRRIHELAFFRAVIFMESSNCTEYFMQQFRPGVDYVAVAEDFSDLEALVRQVNSDPLAAERMASSWVDRARTIFSLTCVLDYIDKLLRAYAKLQRFTPPPRPEWGLYNRKNPESVSPALFTAPGSVQPEEEFCPMALKMKQQHARFGRPTC